jgi:uncharacterized tellurite resistance protein B-like protein
MAPQDRGGDPRETETIRAIVARLEALPPDRAAIVGGFAYVLGRIAYADLEISAAETAEMERILRDWSGLDDALAVLVVEIARRQAALEGATEDYLVTRRFREVSTVEEREQLLHCMFAVATAAGDTISAEENATIRQVADELGFTLAELNVVRRQYAERLSALQ